LETMLADKNRPNVAGVRRPVKGEKQEKKKYYGGKKIAGRRAL